MTIIKNEKNGQWQDAVGIGFRLTYFFVTIGLGLINFTNYFDNEKALLQILSIYFLGYAIVWALTIAISKQFPKNYLKLGQWVLLLLISGLIYSGTT